MLKVLHILWSARFGGIETLVYDLCREQSKGDRIRPGVFMAQAEGEMLGKYRNLHIPLFEGNFTSGFPLRLRAFNDARKAFSEFDILHFHLFNPALAAAAAMSGKRIVYTEHGNFAFGRRMRIADHILFSLRRHFLNKHADYVTFNSRFTMQWFEKNLSLASRVPQEVVYNGIKQEAPLPGHQPEKFVRDLRKKLSNDFIIGTACRLVPFKRVDRLLQAFAVFLSSAPAPFKCTLLILGDGPQRDALERLANELGISDRVVFTGYTKNVHDYYEWMDVCVVPSENEPFGLTVIEMLANGKPVIVFADGGGAAELIGQFSKSDVVGDIGGLASRLAYYYGNEARGSLSPNKDFAKRFSIEKMSEELAKIYVRANHTLNPAKQDGISGV